jgi:hypothetical protein
VTAHMQRLADLGCSIALWIKLDLHRCSPVI